MTFMYLGYDLLDVLLTETRHKGVYCSSSRAFQHPKVPVGIQNGGGGSWGIRLAGNACRNH